MGPNADREATAAEEGRRLRTRTPFAATTVLQEGSAATLFRTAEPRHCVARLEERGLAEALEAWQGLAALCAVQHPRLVAYHEAWVEGDDGAVYASTGAASPRRLEAEPLHLPHSPSADELSESVNSSITAITFTDYNMTDSDEDPGSGDEHGLLEGEFGSDAFAHDQAAAASVFVRMDLHAPSLEEFLSSRTACDAAESTAILRCVVEGLAHLHGAGIVHGRLHPRHIFLLPPDEEAGGAVVGGMGLAPVTAMATADADAGHEDDGDEDDVAQLYRCPTAADRAEGDMYALGMLALELFHAPEAHARMAALKGARRRILPRALLMRQPTVAATVLWLLAPEAGDRPGAAELLHSALFAAPPAAPTVLIPRTELESLDKRIQTQEHTISRQEHIIRAQERRIQALAAQVKRSA